MSGTGAGERRKSVVETAEEEAKMSSDHRRKHALERLGVYHPKSKEESQVASLQNEVKELRDALDRERAHRFRDEQKSKSLQRREDQSLSSELASLSRKLHETRANHQEEIKRVQAKAVADVEDQIEKKRGPAFERLQEHMMGLLKTQIDAGHGDLLDRVVKATAQFVEHECAEGSTGTVFSSLREGIEARLRKSCELRTGDFYESIERDIRGQLAKESAAEQAQRAADAEALEREYHHKLVTAVEEMQVKLHAEHAKLREELNASMHETSEASLEALMQLFHHKADETVEAVLAETTRTHEAVSERLGKHLETLTAVQESHASKMRGMVDEGAARLTEALAKQRQASEAREGCEKDALTSQVEALSKIVDQEREAWEASLDGIRAQHETSRQGFENLLAQERARMETEKSSFEESLRAQYELLAGALREEHAETAQKAMERQLELSAREATMQQTEARLAAEATKRADERAAARWELALREKAAAWKREEEERRVMLQSDLSKRFDSQLRSMEERIEAVHKLRADAEEAWEQEQTRVLDTFAHSETRFKETCERLFHERMDRYVRASDERLRGLQEEILQQAATAAEARAQLELRVEQLRVHAELDKTAYVAQVQEKHESALVAMQQQHGAAQRELAKELRKAREEILMLKSAHVQAVQETMSDRISDSVELGKLRDRLAEEDARHRAGKRVLQEHRDRIVTLWATLQLSAADLEAFFLEVFHAAPYSPAFEKVLERHVHMLAARIPIAKLLAEREALASALSQGKWDVRNAPQERVEKERLLTRLGGLNKRLEVELGRFGARFPTDAWGEACRQDLGISLRTVPGATLAHAASRPVPVSPAVSSWSNDNLDEEHVVEL